MKRWMETAFDEAFYGVNNGEGGPFGAVIIKDGILISQAHNKVLTSNDPTAHAEINAIRFASQKLNTFDLSGCTLFTTCMPCPMCLGAIMWSRISQVYYTATAEDAKNAGFDDEHFYEKLIKKDKGIHLKHLDSKRSLELFDLWNKKEDRRIY